MEKDFGGHHCAVCRDRALAERARKPGFRPDPVEEQRKYDEMMARQRALEDQGNAAWEAKEAREEATHVKITLRIGVFFDGTGNNPFNVEMGRKCGAHHPVSAQDMDGSCKPYMQDPDSSYGGEVTNVKRLHELYAESNDSQKIIQKKLAFDRVYVEGIGTIAGGQDNLLGMAFGRGETGIEARVFQAFGRIKQRLHTFHELYPDIQISSLVFDVFGFSRGAAAARHFACLCLARINSPLTDTLYLPNSLFARGFSKVFGEGINTGFVGLFDTVASVGGLSNLGDVRSPAAPGVKLYLMPQHFPNVLQLMARDEYRANFALNKVGPDHLDISLPGAHSDIGGGYRDDIEECLLLSPMQALEVSEFADVKTTSIYRDAQRERANWHAKGWPLEMLELVTPDPVMLLPEPREQNAPKQKRVFVGLQLRRKVSAGLSRVYLRVMYEAAKKHGVEFDDIRQRAALAPPAELQPLCERFVAGDYLITAAEEQLLKLHYIHLSAHWTPTFLSGPRITRFEMVYVNAPTTDAVRVYHPHVPEWTLRP
ncbi:phospholipase effector Tle1 domain-containing protein [Pseudomonas sp. S2_A02]